MNDSTPPPRPDCTMYFDVSHGGDIAVERCDEAIAALLARLDPKTPPADGGLPEFVIKEIPLEEIPLIGDDPGRPAA